MISYLRRCILYKKLFRPQDAILMPICCHSSKVLTLYLLETQFRRFWRIRSEIVHQIFFGCCQKCWENAYYLGSWVRKTLFRQKLTFKSWWWSSSLSFSWNKAITRKNCSFWLSIKGHEFRTSYYFMRNNLHL